MATAAGKSTPKSCFGSEIQPARLLRARLFQFTSIVRCRCSALRNLLLGLLVLCGVPAGAWGGLYNPCEPREPDEGPFPTVWLEGKNGFRDILLRYRSLGGEVEQDNPMRRRYVLMQQALPNTLDKLSSTEKLAWAKLKELNDSKPEAPDEKWKKAHEEAVKAHGKILLQLLSVSEYMIRRGEAQRAQVLLVPLSGRAGGNFLIACNLAAAFERTALDRPDDYQRAIDAIHGVVEGAKCTWPATWEELSPEQLSMLKSLHWSEHVNFDRFREAERFFFKMLKSRQREAQKKRKRPGDTEIDALFFKDKDFAQAVRYVDENGGFTPGKLADAELAKLPDQSIDHAMQIVQQLLVWMPTDRSLYRQLGELYSARGTPADLHAARMIFNELVETMMSRNEEVRNRRQILENFAIPEPLAPKQPEDLKKIVTKPEEESAKISWRDVGVIFGFGIIVGVVGQWQINEIRRRRHRMAQITLPLQQPADVHVEPPKSTGHDR
jgi:hypothetical protein